MDDLSTISSFFAKCHQQYNATTTLVVVIYSGCCHILWLLSYSLVVVIYSIIIVYVRRGKDANKNRAEWEREREGMKREMERLKHELLRLVSLMK